MHKQYFPVLIAIAARARDNQRAPTTDGPDAAPQLVGADCRLGPPLVRDAERRVIEQLADPALRASTSRERGLPTSQWSDQLLAVLTDEQRAAYQQKLGPPPETDAERIGQHVFALLDTNGDDELSQEEWGSADIGRLFSPGRSRLRVTLPLARESRGGRRAA